MPDAAPGPSSQAIFRRTLEALASPGRSRSLALPSLATFAPPAPLSSAMGALMLTLLDAETSLWLSPAFDTQVLRAWLPFHTGARITQDIGRARFAALRGDPCGEGLRSREQSALLDTLDRLEAAGTRRHDPRAQGRRGTRGASGLARWHARELTLDGGRMKP